MVKLLVLYHSMYGHIETMAQQINAQQRADFLAVLQALAVVRRRDGAWEWGVTEEAEHPGKLTEWFLVESWGGTPTPA